MFCQWRGRGWFGAGKSLRSYNKHVMLYSYDLADAPVEQSDILFLDGAVFRARLNGDQKFPTPAHISLDLPDLGRL